MTKLLAIGGPLEGQWLPDFGMQTAVFPVPSDIKLNWDKEPSVNEIIAIKTAVYAKQTVGGFDKEGEWHSKKIYYHKDTIASYGVEEALLAFLLSTFVEMKDTDDN